MRSKLRSIAGGLVVAVTFWGSAEAARAQDIIIAGYCPPTVSYYAAPRVVSYTPATVSYYTPSVAYYPASSVSYYAAPRVSYYAAPAVSYYPGAVSTTRYGLFGQPRETRAYYPTYVLP